MLALKIFCWSYLLFITLGRAANYDKTDNQSMKVKIIDNLMIIVLIIALAILHNL